MAVQDQSLKDANRRPLLAIIVANALAFYLLATSGAIAISGFSALVKSGVNALPAGAIFVFTSVLVELLNAKWKARLVFWRWHHPLPGARAFSEYVDTDDRIDTSELRRKIGDFPTSPKDQNSRWYKLYLASESDPRIQQVHKGYLFTRDYAAISVIFLAIGGIAMWWLVSHLTAAVYDAALIAQYLIVRQSAKHHGERFVTSVLALTAAR